MKKISVFAIILIMTSLFLLSVTSSSAQKFTIDKKIELDQLPQLKTESKREVVLFKSYRNVNVDIYAYLLNQDSKPVLTHIPQKVIQLTDDQYNYSNPCLSPDGSQIAFASDRQGISRIFIMNTDGTNLRRLTASTNSTEVESYPVWSPDGEKLAFEAWGGINIMKVYLKI